MPGLALPSDAFRLGDLIVVPSLNRLVRGTQTEDLEPRVMRVLAVLAETPGEVVSRAHLFESVWADTVVNDEALTRAVSELRKALGAEASGAVETIRGSGYRLSLPIAPLAPEAAVLPPSSSRNEDGSQPSLSGGGPLVVLALLLAGISLLVALWAAWPRESPEAEPSDASLGVPEFPRNPPEAEPDEPMRLDSTSPYYRPGMSELGVYYDSTKDAYFRFETDNTE